MTSRYGRTAVALLALLAAIAAWNTLKYPPGLGYDAIDHIAYAEGILHGHGFPTVSASTTRRRLLRRRGGRDLAGPDVGLGEPLRVSSCVNGSPSRRRQCSCSSLPGSSSRCADGFTSPRSASSCSECWRRGRQRWSTPSRCALLHDPGARAGRSHDRAEGLDGALGVGLGAALGAAQLVRAFSLWTSGSSFSSSRSSRSRGATSGGVPCRVARDGARDGRRRGPWYAYQSPRYTDPMFDRPQVQVPSQAAAGHFYLIPELRSSSARRTRPPRQPVRAPALCRRLGGLLRRLRLAQP